ncbi:virulence-associated E family protein [Corynebacterium poyangense]|uniref:virulence-associated E family protein n=1 Tax=Corynebacterium poyangense TaxID=2684405 RepID=UPI001CAA8290|nr:virulence-associated E family protein [Corynebacterium poyangense]
MPRVDTLLVDYLGAEDSAYTRAVTRKTLCAAVKRVWEPGSKFDSMLVLNGPQGIGKSTLIAKLAGQWFSDSLNLSDTKDKTAAEKLQSYWILEVGELAGLRKTEVETLRSFLSRQNVIYRAALGRRATPHPRQCMFFSTTNAESGYLRDTTGNRRFWPVITPGTGTKHPGTSARLRSTR